MATKGRRSDICLKVLMEQSKSQDPLDQALSQINLIVGMVNRRMEDLTSSDLQRNAADNLEAYLSKVESGELKNGEQVRPQMVLEVDSPSSDRDRRSLNDPSS